jgi:hypothetical protein
MPEPWFIFAWFNQHQPGLVNQPWLTSPGSPTHMFFLVQPGLLQPGLVRPGSTNILPNQCWFTPTMVSMHKSFSTMVATVFEFSLRLVREV